jgi:hypothetical protein
MSEKSLAIELKLLRATMETAIKLLDLVEARALVQEGQLGQQTSQGRPAKKARPPLPQRRSQEAEP